MDELEAEEAAHGFGFEPNPLWSRMIAGYLMPADTNERLVLARPWSVPAERRPYPLTFEEEAAAPWPLEWETGY